MEKKKLILKLNPAVMAYAREGRRSFREPIFAFVAAPYALDGKLTTNNLTQMTYCRESFCEYIRQQLRGVRHQGIDLTKLHMVIHRKVVEHKSSTPQDFQNQVAAGQAMVNAIEKHYGWPLTKVYPVEFVQEVPENCKFFYITASKRWIKAPAMLSLFTLLFRIAANETKFKFKHRIRSMKSLFAVLDEVAAKSSFPETRYYATHGNNWKLVLSNYRKLFSSRTMADLYFPKSASNLYFFTEGINQLCDVSSRDKILNKTFEKLVLKKAGKK